MNDDPMKISGIKETALQRAIRDLRPLQNILADEERIARIIEPTRGLLGDATRDSHLINQAMVQSGLMSKYQDFSFKTVFPEIAGRFQLPDSAAITALREGLMHPGISEVLERYHLQAETIARAMSEMKSPWLDLQNQMRSISALTELHGIGHTLTTLPAFDNSITTALRTDLGDWRAPLALNLRGLLDPEVRSEFYVARGFNPALTDFPAPAFRDGLEAAGLYEEVEPQNIEAENDEFEAAFMRTNEAHDRLMRFEFHLRIFIEDAMTIAVGSDWVRHRVSDTMRTTWEDKKNRGIAAGEGEQPLIAYADFTDYVEIIIRRDNWREVFGEMFQHKPSVEESFRRLYPVRVCTMHARPITQDDALYLLVEIKRLSKAMGFDL